MKRTLPLMLVIVLLIGAVGCKNKQPSSNYDPVEVLKDTCFDTGMDVFKNMTFGEVMDKLIAVSPDDNDVTYKVNEKMNDYDLLESILDDYPEKFDADKYDYISALVGFELELTGEFYYEEVIFSVDKGTKEVKSLVRSVCGDPYECDNYYDGTECVSALYLMVSLATEQ